MKWNSVVNVPMQNTVVLVYDRRSDDYGFGRRANNDSWLWLSGPLAITIKDGENQISHWMYLTSPPSEEWTNASVKPPLDEKLLLYHLQESPHRFSIGYLMSNGLWKLTNTISAYIPEPFPDEQNRIISHWMLLRKP